MGQFLRSNRLLQRDRPRSPLNPLSILWPRRRASIRSPSDAPGNSQLCRTLLGIHAEDRVCKHPPLCRRSWRSDWNLLIQEVGFSLFGFCTLGTKGLRRCPRGPGKSTERPSDASGGTLERRSGNCRCPPLGFCSIRRCILHLATFQAADTE